MEPDQVFTDRYTITDSKSPLPKSYKGWLKQYWSLHPTNVTISRRLIPLRHILIYLVILLALSGVCYTIGLVFWKVIIPSSYTAQRVDTITRFLAGWLILSASTLASIMLNFIWAFVSIVLCGKGVDAQI